MTPDPYRKAYEKAIEDLSLISETFESLITRKKLVENVVAALQPMFAAMEHASHEIPSHAPAETPQVVQEASTDALEATEPAGGYSFLDVPAPLPSETDGDPFQRRVRANFRFKGLTAQRSN